MRQALDATLELLEERTFDDVSITEILERAGQSTGQFYARFASKDAVFQELVRRLEARVQERVTDEVRGWKELARPDRVRRLVGLVARLNVEHRPVLRSMLLRVWRDPGGHARFSGRVRNEGFEALLLRCLAPDDDGPIDERTARWVMATVAATCRHQLLFGELFDVDADDPEVEEMVDVLTRMTLHGLGVPAKNP